PHHAGAHTAPADFPLADSADAGDPHPDAKCRPARGRARILAAMDDSNQAGRPAGAVGGMFSRRARVRDVEAADADPLPDRPENAPRRLIDPALLTDELTRTPAPAPRPARDLLEQMPIPGESPSEHRRRRPAAPAPPAAAPA